MIKNILFDMGNVLIRFDRNYFLDRLGICEEDKQLLMREVFLSVEWVQMDRGNLCEETAAASCCRRLPPRLHNAAEELFCRWDQPAILTFEGMYELIEELKGKGYGIYLLSNASARQHTYWSRIPESKFFDGKIISADERMMKPQPEIYLRTLDRFRLKADECFFIDDVPANIEGAMFCGMHGTVFHGDIPLLRRQLRSSGVDVNE